MTALIPSTMPLPCALLPAKALIFSLTLPRRLALLPAKTFSQKVAVHSLPKKPNEHFSTLLLLVLRHDGLHHRLLFLLPAFAAQ